jgi:hypothetical protein
MSRSLRNRLRALAKGREPNAVIEALAVIESTGTAPSGAAGDRAAALWQQATDLGITERGTTGRHDEEISALMELVRYKYTIYSADAGVPGFVLFRMLSPIWFDSVDG